MVDWSKKCTDPPDFSESAGPLTDALDYTARTLEPSQIEERIYKLEDRVRVLVILLIFAVVTIVCLIIIRNE